MNKKFGLLFILSLIILFFINTVVYSSELPEKWQNCGTDMACAKKISGFEFPLNIKKYKIKAADNFVEILMPFDKFRTVELRKTQGSPFADISSCKKDFFVKDEINLSNDEVLFTQGEGKKIYTVNFWYDGYDYSVYCKKGLTKNEVIKIYEIIKSSVNKTGKK